MRLLYFAALRDALGRREEEVSPPPEVGDVSGLLAWLRRRDPALDAFDAGGGRIRVAVNRRFAAGTDAVAVGDEVALFPPVTGG